MQPKVVTVQSRIKEMSETLELETMRLEEYAIMIKEIEDEEQKTDKHARTGVETTA